MPIIQELDFRNPSPKSSSASRFNSESLGTNSPRYQMSLNVNLTKRASNLWIVRNKAVQQQQEAAQQNQVQGTQSQRGPFPWVRVIVAFFIIFAMVLLAVLAFLATGHVIDTTWVLVAPLLSGLVIAIIPILQWLFPLNPIAWRSGSNLPQLVPDPPHSQTLPAASDAKTVQTPPSSPITLGTPVPQRPMVPAVHIFHFNEPLLPNPAEFYGREYERMELIHRTSIRASTAIMGDYRIGKSWLMQYLQQVAPSHPQLGSHLHVGHISATHPQCQTLVGFVERALATLNVPSHNTHRSREPLERLAGAARDLKSLGIIPVLCIDEFAGLIGKPSFDKSFVNGLRAIAEDDGIVLITASKQSLHEVIERMTGETSPLFNIMPQLGLKPFTEAEAKHFAEEKSQQAGFSDQEQAFFLECAAIHQPDGMKVWPPMRLQLTGKLLLDDKRMLVSERRSHDAGEALYRIDFKQRLEEQYGSVVRNP